MLIKDYYSINTILNLLKEIRVIKDIPLEKPYLVASLAFIV